MLGLPGESQHIDVLVAVQSAVALEDQGAILGPELHGPGRLRLLVVALAVASLISGNQERIGRRAPSQERRSVGRVIVFIRRLDLAFGALLVLVADEFDNGLLLLLGPVLEGPYAASQDQSQALLLRVGVRIACAQPDGLVVQVPAAVLTLKLACDGEYGVERVGPLVVVSDIMLKRAYCKKVTKRVSAHNKIPSAQEKHHRGGGGL